MQGFPSELCNFRLLDYSDSKYTRERGIFLRMHTPESNFYCCSNRIRYIALHSRYFCVAFTQLLLDLVKLTLIYNTHYLTSLSLSQDDNIFSQMLTLLTPSLPKHTGSLDRTSNPQHIDCFLIRSTQLGFLPQNVTGLP